MACPAFGAKTSVWALGSKDFLYEAPIAAMRIHLNPQAVAACLDA
jgi:hypothetical protein